MNKHDGNEVTYRCAKCGAEDHDRGLSLPYPIVLNCYNCGAGKNMEIKDMIATGQGMFRPPSSYDKAGR